MCFLLIQTLRDQRPEHICAIYLSFILKHSSVTSTHLNIINQQHDILGKVKVT